MEHASEAAADLESYLSYLAPLAGTSRSIHLLDFGCGDGSFLAGLLSRAGFEPQRLILSLVEPDAVYLAQASSRIKVFSRHPVSAWRVLPTAQHLAFDLILSNHVFYYVKDIRGTLEQLLRTLAIDGCLLISMADRDNLLAQIIARGFDSLQEAVPYYYAADLEWALKTLSQDYKKQELYYQVTFPDLKENRLKLLRFLLGEHLARMEQKKSLSLLDPYAAGGRISINTWHYQFVIKKKAA